MDRAIHDSKEKEPPRARAANSAKGSRPAFQHMAAAGEPIFEVRMKDGEPEPADLLFKSTSQDPSMDTHDGLSADYLNDQD